MFTQMNWCSVTSLERHVRHGTIKSILETVECSHFRPGLQTEPGKKYRKNIEPAGPVVAMSVASSIARPRTQYPWHTNEETFVPYTHFNKRRG